MDQTAWSTRLGRAVKARRQRSMASLSEFQRMSRRRLPRVIWDFVEGGAGDESLLVESRSALRTARLVPRRMVDAGVRQRRGEGLGEAPVRRTQRARAEAGANARNAQAEATKPPLCPCMNC